MCVFTCVLESYSHGLGSCSVGKSISCESEDLSYNPQNPSQSWMQSRNISNPSALLGDGRQTEIIESHRLASSAW